MAAAGARRHRPLGDGSDERSEARERALLLLYEMATKRVSATEVLGGQVVAPDELTRQLVLGVETHRARLDEVIAAHATGWTIARMPLIDVTVMRIAGFELLARPEVPVAVVIDEAVELAKRFSTDQSGKFVNGVLAAMVGELRTNGG